MRPDRGVGGCAQRAHESVFGRHSPHAHRTTVRSRGTNDCWPPGGASPTVDGTDVKNISTLLWFLAGWCGARLLGGGRDLPSSWGLLGGLATAAVVRWDPTGHLWN